MLLLSIVYKETLQDLKNHDTVYRYEIITSSGHLDAVLTRVVFHHVLVVPVRGRRQVHGRSERGEQSDVAGRIQFGGGRAEFTDNGIAA